MIIFNIWYKWESDKKRKEILDSREKDKGARLNDKLTKEESRRGFRDLPTTYR